MWKGWLVLVFFLLPPILGLSWVDAREDTALLSFQKLLPAEELGKPYVIRSGDTLYGIIRRRLGIRSAKEAEAALDLIKKLNPQITDPRKIRPGQSIVLPDQETPVEKDAFGVKTVFYKVKKGDSLERILMTQLNVRRSEMSKILLDVKEMNPRLTNVDHIVVNQVLRLPGATPEGDTGDSYLTEDVQGADFDPDKPVVLSESLKRNLLLSGEVLNRFRATLITSGQYYIPLEQYGQIVIDCSSIPMVEFDDGSIVFIELKTRLPERVKTLIRERWPDYRFTTAHEKDTLVSILRKVFNQSTPYRMKQGGKYTLGEKMTVHITPGWTVEQTGTPDDDGKPLRQGLVFYRDASRALPGYLPALLSAQGITLTEVALDSGIIRDGTDMAEASAAPDLAGSSQTDLVHNLLVLLGEEAAKDVEINLFDRKRRGFNLTMRADIMMKKDGKRVVVSFGKIPREFSDMLKKDGTEILPLNKADSSLKIITRVLGYLNVSHTFNYFRLTVNHPDDPEAPFITAIFPALQVYRENKFLYYLVDFPFDPEFYSYFKQLKEVSIIRY